MIQFCVCVCVCMCVCVCEGQKERGKNKGVYVVNWRLLNYVRPLIKQHKNAARIPHVISIPHGADFSLKNRPEVGTIH